MSEPRARFDVDTLRRLAGDRILDRGEAYHREGRVAIVAIEGGRVLAHVIGTEDYWTEIIARNKALGGECSCPAFEDVGLCKHIVAVALAANAVTGDEEIKVIGALTRLWERLRQVGLEVQGRRSAEVGAEAALQQPGAGRALEGLQGFADHLRQPAPRSVPLGRRLDGLQAPRTIRTQVGLGGLRRGASRRQISKFSRKPKLLHARWGARSRAVGL